MNKYNTQIFEVNGEFILMIKELNIIVKDKSLEGAYCSLNKEKSDYLLRMENAGLSIGSDSFSSPKVSNIREFILKSLIITGLCLLLFAISGFIGGVSFKKGMNTVGEKVSSRASEISTLSEEEKLKLFREKLDTVKPYIIELKKVINE